MAVQMLDTVLVMKPKRSQLVKSTPVEKAVDTTIDNVYGDKNIFCTCPSMDEFKEDAA